MRKGYTISKQRLDEIEKTCESVQVDTDNAVSPRETVKHSHPLPCPFCGVPGHCGVDGAYYFMHVSSCWISKQRGTLLNCVSMAELDAWNTRVDHADAEAHRAMLAAFARPDQMRNDVAPAWDSRDFRQ